MIGDRLEMEWRYNNRGKDLFDRIIDYIVVHG